MTYRVSLNGGAHDGGVVESEARPPERIQRVHRVGEPSRLLSTTYVDTGAVSPNGTLIYVVEPDS